MKKFKNILACMGYPVMFSKGLNGHKILANSKKVIA